MKKSIFALSLFLLAALPTTQVFAVTHVPTPTSQPANNLEQQITNLKDKIASRVAQLKLVDKRGIIGTVTDVNATQITLTDIKGNTRFVDVDELTKFTSPSAKNNFGISDITKGTTIGVLGLYNKESRRILARFVDVLVLPVTISGAVTDLDSTNFTVTVATADKKSYSVDIEGVTKTYAYDGATLAKSGFSKINQAERISVIGYVDTKNSTHIIATRVILFPTLPVDPNISIVKPEDLQLKGTIVPATGSGIKLTPLRK